MACGLAASAYRPYAPRARWVRTANDSYFTAMSYPQGMSGMPSNIHDATWGILSAVYGGAIHPTAEGHAAMADGALPKARAVLGRAAADRNGYLGATTGTGRSQPITGAAIAAVTLTSPSASSADLRTMSCTGTPAAYPEYT